MQILIRSRWLGTTLCYLHVAPGLQDGSRAGLSQAPIHLIITEMNICRAVLESNTCVLAGAPDHSPG